MDKPQERRFKLFLVKGKAVKIIQTFNHSTLVEYVKTGKQASINPALIKTKVINYEVKPESPQQKLEL